MLLNVNTNTASSSRPKVIAIRGVARQLESLYARRTAVEALIHSLEDYQRFRAHKMTRQDEPKTA